ncbi:MAG: bacteriocin ABC transporter ATP-binding protein [Candidatus Epulonipiscioides saccharophilum]|nr:MAG: bacteriocin ABC transporter ATP-binding protein [Epulopiscium sp. AS2M-Bin001]
MTGLRYSPKNNSVNKPPVNNILEVNHLRKVYTTKFNSNSIEALKDISFSVQPGEFVAIMGESGSGKTTLLNILSALDRPTDGTILLKGKQFSSIKEKELARFRREELGFVYQDFNLLDSFSVKDNILLPLVLSKISLPEMKRRIIPVAQLLNIHQLLNKYPYEISGGQQQRVCIARAIITNPDILLADEPTGALDSKTAGEILSEFKNINANHQTILMVTHSVKAASVANRVLFIKDGLIYHQLYRKDQSEQQFFESISNTLITMQNGGNPNE